MIKIHRITSEEGFQALSSIWDVLLHESGSSTIFSTFEWLHTWWECFGKDKKLLILLAKDKEEIIGIAPLMIEKKKILNYVPIKVVSFIGTGISDYSDFIIAGGRELVLNCFLGHIWENKHLWHEIDLREIREDSPNLDVIQNILKDNPYYDEINCLGKCPYIPVFGDWVSYYSSLSRNFRQDIRTQYNRLRKDGTKYDFSHIQNPTDDAFLNHLIDLHLKGTNIKGKRSFLESKEGKNFFKQIIERDKGKGNVAINVLYIDDEIAAYSVGFLFNNKYYYWNIGKNDKYDDFSPGKLLLRNILMEYFSNNSIKEFDFLRGEEDYKYRWTKMERKNYRVHIRNDTLKTKLVYEVQDVLHAIRQNQLCTIF